MDCWGVRLNPVDHDLLARTNLFEILHRIMDSSRDVLADARRRRDADGWVLARKPCGGSNI
jgi:hypothetical protein